MGFGQFHDCDVLCQQQKKGVEKYWEGWCLYRCGRENERDIFALTNFNDGIRSIVFTGRRQDCWGSLASHQIFHNFGDKQTLPTTSFSSNRHQIRLLPEIDHDIFLSIISMIPVDHATEVSTSDAFDVRVQRKFVTIFRSFAMAWMTPFYFATRWKRNHWWKVWNYDEEGD